MRACTAVSAPIVTAPARATPTGMRAVVIRPILPVPAAGERTRLRWNVAVSARTRTLLTWLPAGILVVVIGADRTDAGAATTAP